MIVLPDNIRNIIVSKLQGHITPEEERVLDEWQLQDEAHEREFNQYSVLWSVSGQTLLERGFDTEMAWVRLDQRLRNDLPVMDVRAIYPRRKIMIRKLTRVTFAAALVGLVILTCWQLFKRNENIDWNVVVARDANRYLRLPDNSSVLLRKGATITYKTTFGHSDRQVELKGDAFFQVAQEMKLPFSVQTEKSLVKVLGTSFVISTTAQNERVVVTTGKVIFSAKAHQEDHCVVAAQEEVLYTGAKFIKRKVSDSNYLSWKTDVLMFADTPLEKVVDDLSAYYKANIKVDDALKERTIKITATFQKQVLQDALSEIMAVAGLHYRNVGDTMIIY